MQGDTYTEMPCAHRYHTKCILPWLSDHNTCPTCRAALPLESDASGRDASADGSPALSERMETSS
eukprot:SAG11_NODE_6583_length_1284_cov_1.345148_1_plen_64_part_10